jgi:hypothetical protein
VAQAKRSRVEPLLQIGVGDRALEEAERSGTQQLSTGTLQHAERGPARLPPRLTRVTPSENRVGASVVLASPATTLSGPRIAAPGQRQRVNADRDLGQRQRQGHYP